MSLSSAVSQRMQQSAEAVQSSHEQQQVLVTKTVLTIRLSIVSCNNDNNWNNAFCQLERWKHDYFECGEKKTRKYHTICQPTKNTSSDVRRSVVS